MADIVTDLLKELSTSKDWNEIPDDKKASTLVLSFIGYVARPKNIPPDILKKAVDAFNNCHAGKVEKEIEAVNQAIGLVRDSQDNPGELPV